METTIKTISIELLAEKLNGKLWSKGDIKRIYLDEGYNTKKMSTKTYVFERKDGTFGVSCVIDCPSQHDNWIEKEQSDIILSLESQIDNIIEEFGFEIENPQIEIQAKLEVEEQVQGYYLRWHEVRIAINHYGKLAYRKRQKVHTYTGAISKIPAGFVQLNDDDFAIALEKEQKETLYEYGCEPNLVGESERLKESKVQQELADKIQKENWEKQEAIENEKKLKEREILLDKLKDFNNDTLDAILINWKLNGCIHPAPIEVLEVKEKSGLNWKKFTASIN